jgi:hypothetical protein
MRLLICLCCFLFFPDHQVCKNRCFEIIKATSQTYVAGIKNGGKGTSYRITCISSSSSEDLKIDKLWIGQDLLEAKAFKYTGITPEEKFAPGDTIIIEASRFTSGHGENLEQSKANIPPPIKYKGEGLIGYRCGKKTKYRSVKKFEELPRINTP